MEALILYSEVCGNRVKVILEMIGVKFQCEHHCQRPNKIESETYIY